jgi:hypothetical protein
MMRIFPVARTSPELLKCVSVCSIDSLLARWQAYTQGLHPRRLVWPARTTPAMPGWPLLRKTSCVVVDGYRKVGSISRLKNDKRRESGAAQEELARKWRQLIKCGSEICEEIQCFVTSIVFE